MSLPEYTRINFQTMLRAAQDGQLALMECIDKRTGKPVSVVCMVNQPEGEDIEMVPVATMFDVSPYDVLEPPQ